MAPLQHLFSGYDCANEPVLPSREDLDALDCIVQNDALRVDAIAASSELSTTVLTNQEVADLLEFLQALTDPGSIDLRGDVPRSLPSGLTLVE